ncbi:fucolectin-1-like [Notothenia coriiceps]|uniref:Fucolectin-1-like n=1 Tax=Notothenia coriiceps TaxID=8208 RepID=A0A6I9MLB3_9TELE|nr:PREDICTED: fucolectin-1-like [Notothenia coriiceps]
MEGQYVTIVIRGRAEFLTLCEVEVTVQPSGTINIAKGGKVTQSSIAFYGYPQRAVDGNLASSYTQKSCTHTRKQRNPWWRLDLQKTYRINTVTITNRKDCCSDRINGAEIRVGNSLHGRPNPICAVISSIEAGTSKTFECNGMEGQYVTIVIRGRREFLTLCEVEVTGTEAK